MEVILVKYKSKNGKTLIRVCRDDMRSASRLMDDLRSRGVYVICSSRRVVEIL